MSAPAVRKIGEAGCQSGASGMRTEKEQASGVLQINGISASARSCVCCADLPLSTLGEVRMLAVANGLYQGTHTRTSALTMVRQQQHSANFSSLCGAHIAHRRTGTGWGGKFIARSTPTPDKKIHQAFRWTARLPKLSNDSNATSKTENFPLEYLTNRLKDFSVKKSF